MAIDTKEFATPFSERQATANLVASTRAHVISDVESKQLYLSHSKTMGVQFMDTFGTFRVAGALNFKTRQDGSIEYAVANMSNDQLLPVQLGPEVIKNFVSVAPKGQVPKFALHGPSIPKDSSLLKDLSLPWHASSSPTMFVLPMVFMLPFGQGWVEARSADPTAPDAIADAYGKDAKLWANQVIWARENLDIIGTIFDRAELSGKLDELLGAKCDTLHIHLQGPTVSTSPLTSLGHPDDLKALSTRLGPYKSVTPPPGPAPAPPAAPVLPAAMSVADVANVVASAALTKEERQMIEKLKAAQIVINSIFIAGEVDLETGAITSLQLPESTAAYLACNKLTDKAEKTSHLKRMFDTASRRGPKNGEFHALRNLVNMKEWDTVLVQNWVAGNFAERAMTNISDKIRQVNMACFLPQGVEVLAKVADEKARQTMEDTMDEDKSNRSKKRTYIFLPSQDLTSDNTQSLCANFVCSSQTCFRNDGAPPTKPMVTRFVTKALGQLLDRDTKNWFHEKNTPAQQEQFLWFLLGRLDAFFCGMVRAGNDFTNNEAVRAGTMEDMLPELYERATIIFADDLKEIRKMVHRDKPFDEPALLAPAAPVVPPPKRAKTAPTPATGAGGTAPRGAGAGAGDGSTPASPSGQRGGARSSFGSSRRWSGDGNASQAKKDREEFCKGRGCLVPTEAFLRKSVDPSLANIYCAPFSTVGNFCKNPACTKKHHLFDKWEAEHQTTQIAYVAANSDHISFNARSVRSLPENKKHLLADASGAGAVAGA